MDNPLKKLPLDHLLELRDAYREGRVHMTATHVTAAPEIQTWLDETNNKVAAEVEAEIRRREHKA